MIKCDKNEETKGKQSNTSSAVKNNKRIDDFFTYSSTKTQSSQIPSVNKQETELNDNNNINSDKKYLSHKRSRDDSKDKAIKPKHSKKQKQKINKTQCSICLDGGDLLLCDKCPKSFHLACLKIKQEDMPKGNWYCLECLEDIEKKINKKIEEGPGEIKEKKASRQKYTKNNNHSHCLLKKPEKSIIDSFIKQGNNNENQNKQNLVQRALSPITQPPKNNKYPSFITGIIPYDILESFTTEEQNILIESFEKKKDKEKSSSHRDINASNADLKMIMNNLNNNIYEKMTNEERQAMIIDIMLHLNKSNHYSQILSKIAKKSTLLHNEISKQYCRNLIEHINQKRQKSTFKYPIEDHELYSNPSLHGLSSDYLTKPEGILLPIIAQTNIHSLFKIWDFIQSFAFLTTLSPFPPEYLYIALKNCNNSNKEIPLISEVYSFLLYILIKEIQESDLEDLFLERQEEQMMIKVICNNNNIKAFIKHTWPELVRIVIKDNLDLLSKKIASLTDIHSYTKQITYDEHILILDFLINKAFETEFIRSIIKEEQEKRNDLRKTRRDYEDEQRQIESRRKELERQEKYTQPLQKIESINKRLEMLSEEFPDLNRKALASLRKTIEHERDEFKSMIKESEVIEGRREDIQIKLDQLENDIANIYVIDKKCLGVDAFGDKYYYFPWMNNRLYIKKSKTSGPVWMMYDKESHIKELLKRLSKKGIKEANLVKKLMRVYPKRMSFDNCIDDNYYSNAMNWVNQKVANKPMIKTKIQDEHEDEMIIDINTEIIQEDTNIIEKYNASLYEEISTKMNILEETMTESLLNEEKQWESFDIRCNVKSWLNCIQKIEEFKKTLLLWNNRSNYPYELNMNYNNHTTKIIDDNEYHQNGFYSIIDSNGSISVSPVNPLLQFSLKSKFWSKDFEEVHLEDSFMKYLDKVNTFPGLFFSIYFFESIYNDQTKRRDFQNKRNDNAPIEKAADYIKSFAFNSKTHNKIINDDNDEIIDYNKPIVSRLRKHIQMKNPIHNTNTLASNPKKRKAIDWNETCMFCGEFGDLVCCDECPNVTHLYCAEMKKVPDTWLCKDCSSRMQNRRITRRLGKYKLN